MEQKHSRFENASVEFYEGGSLGKVKREKFKPTQQEQRGGDRGEIQTFSFASRRRLMRFIATLRKDAPALFITLTYPDRFPTDAKRWKRDLKAFSLRLKREYPLAAFIWRLEFKSRKSGYNTGEIAPHYHLILYGVEHTKRKNLRVFQQWLSQAWYEVVNSNDDKHLSAGTGCTPIKSHRGVMAYASKYLSKVEQAAVGKVGRYWGAYFRPNLPTAEPIRIEVTDKQAVRIIRMFRRHSGVRNRAYKSLTVFLDGSQWRRNIEKMLDDGNI